MNSISPSASQVNTWEQYREQERARAAALAPAGPVSEADFRTTCLAYPLPVLRLASQRYSIARGRSYEKVIRGFLAALANPHVNRGDCLAIALGHIEATYQARGQWGIK